MNQKSSNLKRWESIPAGPRLERAYEVEKYIFKYEPLYVARAKDTPPFDERFIGFGMTRNTQVRQREKILMLERNLIEIRDRSTRCTSPVSSLSSSTTPSPTTGASRP